MSERDFEQVFISHDIEITGTGPFQVVFPTAQELAEKKKQSQEYKELGFIFQQENEDRPRTLDYSITRYKGVDKPWLVLVMLHGWTSNKMSMIDQTKQLVAKMSEISEQDQEILRHVWFVQVNAPFKMTSDETGMEKEDEDDIRLEQRFWWHIDGAQILDRFVNNEISKIFQEPLQGIDISMVYLRAVMNKIRDDVGNDASFAFLGFSQGGGMAFNASLFLLEDDFNQCGLLICSGLIANVDECRKRIIRHSRHKALAPREEKTLLWDRFLYMPVFQSHGQRDPTLVTEIGDGFYLFLKDEVKLKRVHYSLFDGYHEITDEVRDKIIKHLLSMHRYHCNEPV